MTKSDPPLLQVRNLAVEFSVGNPLISLLSGRRSRLRAVDGISFHIARGEILGIVGESGSGKTTVGKTVLRLHQPTAGQILVNGEDVASRSQRALKPLRRELQMIFQDPLSSLNPRHSIRKSLATPLRVHGLCPRREIETHIDATLARVGLTPEFKERFPHELSGGQLQRVAIGRALMLSPSLIVADEAVSKLDVSVRAQILNLFKDMQEELGLAFMFITHDLHVARFLCQRILVMYFGQIMEEGSPETLFAKPRHPYTIALLGTLDPHSGPAPATGNAPETGTDATGCRYYSRCAYREERCRIQKPPREEIKPGHSVACFAWKRIDAERESAGLNL